MEYVKRGPCGQDGCRERRYYLQDGVWFCRRGHQQEGRQVEDDPEDYGRRGMVHRVKKVAEEKIRKTCSGRRGYRLFMQAYQFILWRQCHALVHDKGFPTDLEKVVKDLWALRLQSLVDRFDESLDEADDSASTEVFSSQSEVMETVESKTANESSTRKVTENPLLEETLGLCYLGTLMLRLPVSVGDIYRLAMKCELPYFQAIRLVPLEIRDRLSHVYTRALSVQLPLESEHLHETVYRLGLMYSREYNVIFPPLNGPIMIFQFIRRLALPLEVYSSARKLQQILGFSLQFPSDKKTTARELSYPETQLLVLIVVATKLLFPFKTRGNPISATEPAAQVFDWNVWESVQRHFEKRSEGKGQLGKGQEIKYNDGHVFHMSGKQIDDYLDWYENTWIDKNKAANPLASMFPVSRSQSGHHTEKDLSMHEKQNLEKRIRRVISSITPAEIIPPKQPEENSEKQTPDNDNDNDNDNDDDEEEDDPTPRPGHSYQIYRQTSDMPKIARKFYETAADLSGLSFKTLMGAVKRTELKLEKWQRDTRRAELHGEKGVEYTSFPDSEKEGEEWSDFE